jgi:hypothetical protein
LDFLTSFFDEASRSDRFSESLKDNYFNKDDMDIRVKKHRQHEEDHAACPELY